MLKKFSVSGFRGFCDPIELDLTHPRSYAFNSFAVKDGVIKDGIIYGSNGSGKTTFTLALFDIVSRLSSTAKNLASRSKVAYTGKEEALTRFSYTFQVRQDEVAYTYAKDGKGILKEERLAVNGKPYFEKTVASFSIDSSLFLLEAKVKDSLAQNANNVSIVNFLLATYPLPQENVLLQLKQFVDGMLWFQPLEEIGKDSVPFNAITYLIEHHCILDFASFLQDVSGQVFDFQPSSNEVQNILCRIDGETVSFWQIASTGTRALTLLYGWMQYMQKASLVCIDGFDAFLHPQVSYQVCKRLYAFPCQVLLTSHTTSLMTNDLLRPDCNFLLTREGVHSGIHPLCDLTEKDLRFGHNIEKLYRGGAFDAKAQGTNGT
jgi:AAA15 family ATPase/GTPase